MMNKNELKDFFKKIFFLKKLLIIILLLGYIIIVYLINKIHTVGYLIVTSWAQKLH